MIRTDTLRSRSRISAFALAVAATATLISAPAPAANSVRVQRSPDPQVTYQRLQTASAQLCGPMHRFEPARYNVWLRCYETTLQKAVEQLQEPVLLAIHEQHLRSGTTVVG